MGTPPQDPGVAGPSDKVPEARRAVDCFCGELVYAPDDEELLERLVEHARDAHPETRHLGDALRRRVSERAYQPPSGNPPWAY